ncbi:response regulator transcription factor [Pseudoalteromonas sp. AS84]|jgi:DNA-binding response OmpR family regulator|uniref:Response regulator transcription factor n=2 Tax=root TaxID=1 RepID=A0A7X9U7D8_9GAMM|nr:MULTISPECIES: response regulator transcription factor [Pseudoalteromonas]MBH0089808.1 response regulator transcription factor [Pseudoalteromonas sp. NSLLW218]MDN3391009.1 response regulator transcription factor [Pseudoalteromonas sp. APC 3691]NMF48593.1 response regulator transcription factor [Pseudoalteromonas arctica]HDY93086.1 response regulator transcription factor [Pseudoalteromonas sp.]HDZ35185.1 response regulator transcription factor [Pseudoalteromonas sp.]|tara:strand:- start:305 stop:1009 length:705 start_codon:yes stop_codon:yes gene_type:complete
MDNYGTILLVEDDVSLAQWVAEYLTEQGYTTHVCHRGDEVISQVKTLNPNIVLLDIMLPGQDGISVCRELRSFYNSPIIMLTARDEEMDEVIGLEVGASDYIMKPVRPRALLARIKAALRQKNEPNTPHVNESVINVGALSIDTESRNVKLNEQDVNISSAEYLLLHYLASNAGQVVSRDAVFKATKGREYDGLDRSVDVLISALRKKFNDDPQNPEKIKTIWGRGYLLVSTAW